MQNLVNNLLDVQIKMDVKTRTITESFNKNFSSVIDLAEFDQVVLGSAIKSIENVKAIQDKYLTIENPKYKLDNCLKRLNTIRENDSMRITYKSIYNQCVVLLVSYFGSAISDLFEIYINYFIENCPNLSRFIHLQSLISLLLLSVQA